MNVGILLHQVRQAEGQAAQIIIETLWGKKILPKIQQRICRGVGDTRENVFNVSVDADDMDDLKRTEPSLDSDTSDTESSSESTDLATPVAKSTDTAAATQKRRDYSHLDVNDEIRELLDYIGIYKPQQVMELWSDCEHSLT